MRVRILAAVGASVVGSVFAHAPVSAEADEKPAAVETVSPAQQALVGQWTLNAQQSDDPRAKMAEGRREGGWGGGGRGGRGVGGGGGGWGGGGGRHGGWGGGGRGGRDSGGGASAEGRDGQAPSARGMVLHADQITVANLTPEITILGPDGEIRTLHADGKGYKDSAGAEVKTRWDGGKLVVETKTARGRMKETWSVSDVPRRLTVMMEMQRPSGSSVTIKRVFDPSQAGEPPSQAGAQPKPGAEKPKDSADRP